MKGLLTRKPNINFTGVIIMAKVQREKSQSKTDTSKSSGKGNSGNFKDNPERASEAGRKGGSNSHGGGRKS